jgi:hypothetical protein
MSDKAPGFPAGSGRLGAADVSLPREGAGELVPALGRTDESKLANNNGARG